MLLDVSVLRLLSKDDFRILRAVELGMRNHELVPVPLIISISKQRSSVASRSIKELLKHKLLHHEDVHYDGYRLTTSGYDFLALHTLVSRDQIQSFGRRIGTGKESDIYQVVNESGEIMVLKLHRLGRISFRAVKTKRDYLRHRRNFNWLYLSRLAALGEFAFMKALWHRGFPVPQPIDQNRHAVLMSVVDGYPLSQVKQLGDPGLVFHQIMKWLKRFVEVGLVHCDFNEFNLMINEESEVTIIDFPQMVSVWHENAEELFSRDRDCIIKLDSFLDPELGVSIPELQELLKEFYGAEKTDPSTPLDEELRASGFKRSHREILRKHAEGADLDELMPDENQNNSDSSTESSTSDDETGIQFQRPSRQSTDKEITQKVSIEQKKLIQRAVQGKMKRKTNKSNTSKGKHNPGEGFIRARGTQFIDRNCREFLYSGWNSWDLVEAAAGVQRALPQDDSLINGSSYVEYKLDIAKDSGLTVGRFFAHGHSPDVLVLQTSPGVYNENVFQALDRVLAAAAERGLKMILTFADNWKESDSKRSYTDWAGVDPDEFYTDSAVRDWFKNHISTVVNRVNSVSGIQYKNDSTIFAWNLINEPRCECNIRAFDASCEKPCADNMQSWIEEMSAFLKSQDPNHLVTVGEEGFYGLESGREEENPDILAPIINPVEYEAIKTEFNLTDEMMFWAKRSGQDFVRNHDLETIDYAAVHLWPDNWGNLPIYFQSDWLEAHALDCERIGKPMVIEEFGKTAEPNNRMNRTRVRDPYFRDVYSTFNSLRGSFPVKGVAFWRFDGRSNDPPTEHTVYPTHATFRDIIIPNSRALNEDVAALKPAERCFSGETRSYDVIEVEGESYITAGRNLVSSARREVIGEEILALTLESCLMRCQRRMRCQSVVYNEGQELCSLGSDRFDNDDVAWSEDGSQMYWRVSDEDLGSQIVRQN
eukprot:g1957.t1